MIRFAPPFCAALLATAAVAQSPTAPTVGTDPVILDRQWIEASRKFDAPRKTLLATVARTIKAGPFRADYESLNGYLIPS